MQVELYILLGAGDPASDLAHRFVAEISSLQRFDEKSRAHPKLAQAIEQKAEAVFLAGDTPEHGRLGDGHQTRIGKIAADTEFRVDGDANFGGPWSAQCHRVTSFRYSAGAKVIRAARNGQPDTPLFEASTILRNTICTALYTRAGFPVLKPAQ